MSEKLSEEWSKLVHRMGREREDRIISGETKLTVAAIFLIDDNWKVFREYREIIGKPLREEEIEEVEEMLRCKDPRYGFATYVCLGCGTQIQNLLESRKEADERRNRNRLQILCPRCRTEMELLFIAYLKDNELWMIGGWHWLERRLMYREMMQRERQKREEESAQLDFLSALRIAA